MEENALAVDVGYGNTKYTFRNRDGQIACGLFPSTTNWSAVDPTPAIKAEKRNTVAIAVDGVFHEIGEGVRNARGAYRGTNMHDGYVDTSEYKALVLGALWRMNVTRIKVLVMGLPVKHLQNKKASLERTWKGTHELPDGRSVIIDDVRAFAQPQGALMHFAKTTGHASVTRKDLNLIIDPGQRTFDWLVTRGMVMLHGQSSSVNRGMHDIYRAIAEGISSDIGESYEDYDAIDEALRTKRKLVLYQNQYSLKKFDPIVDQITREAMARLLEHVRDVASIQNILLVGGGAAVFRKAVRESFARFRITDIDEPVFANVRGFQAIAEEVAQRSSVADAQPPKVEPSATPDVVQS